ncbi:MAG: cytochrome c biogenesis protein CcsA [Bacteroidetes bacterium]|nr:cytochrome c biogenesis protein CcsA [Bacteroidota bacterium]
MLGSILLTLTVIASGTSLILYGVSFRRSSTVPFARIAFLFSVSGVTAVTVVVLLNILTHQFQYAYVYQYSSRSLSIPLLIASLWAGPEGSLLLWLFFTAWIGIVVLNHATSLNVEREVLLVYTATIFFLTTTLALQSPFTYTWEVFQDHRPNVVPLDGRGLNPLLKNFWMVLHPPLLFLGYALCMVPFAYTSAFLMRLQGTGNVRSILPWVLGALLFLGIGIIVGGYWAYGVLGWGGWWCWDPVENASLFPWLSLLMALHAVIVHMHTNYLHRSVYIFSWLSYFFVVVSTFLTRSGILADSSVHSFLNPSRSLYWMLIVWMVVIFVGGAFLIICRWKHFQRTMVESSPLSRESMVVLGILILGCIGMLVIIGTFLPLFTQRVVTVEYYNTSLLPLAVCLVVTIGISLILQWHTNSRRMFFRKLAVHCGIASCALGGILLLGVRSSVVLLLGFTSSFALSVGVLQSIRIARSNPIALGGLLSHSGVVLFILAIVTSSQYSEKQTVILKENIPQKLYGKEFTFLGPRSTSNDIILCGIEVRDGSSKSILEPSMVMSNDGRIIYKTPDYWIRWNEDIYIEPLKLYSPRHSRHYDTILTMKKNESWHFGNTKFRFVGFQLQGNTLTNMGGTLPLGALIEVRSRTSVDTLCVYSVFDGGDLKEARPTFLHDSSYGIVLLALSFPMGIEVPRVQLGILRRPVNGEWTRALLVEVSCKPWMSMMWASALCVLIGIALAWKRRCREWKHTRGALTIQ